MSDTTLLAFFGLFYGPILLTIAIAVWVASLERPRRGAPLAARLGRHPLFWMIAPPLLAVALAAGFDRVGYQQAVALSAGPAVTLTKTTSTHFTVAGVTSTAYVDTSNNQLTLLSGLTPSTSLTIGPVMPFVTGDGAHAIQSAAGELLIVHGGGFVSGVAQPGATRTSVLSSISQTALAGPTLATAVGKGAFSIPRDDGTFLLVAGGDTDAGASPLVTFIVTPAAQIGGAWTVSAGPNLSGTTGAGNGALAVKFSVLGTNRYLILHAGGGASGTTDTSIYTPSTNTIVAGPALVSAKKASAGAVAVPRNDGTFLVVLGGGGNDTQIYTPPTTSGGIGSFAVGPSIGGPTSEGTFAVQYKNAANLDRYLILRGGTQVAQIYDPAATPATSAGMLGTLSIPNAPHGNSSLGAGAFGYLRGDGSVVAFYGGTNDVALLFTPGSGTDGALASLNLTNTLPMDRGSFALQQADGRYLLFGGSQVETRLNDAGWSLTGTYESEAINPGNVDKWTTVSWSRLAGSVVPVLEWRAASAKDLLVNATYATVPIPAGSEVTSGSVTTGSLAIAPPVANKWMQVRVTLRQTGVPSTGAEAGIWLGESSVVQRRGLSGAPPILYDYTLTYNAGVLVLSATNPETAGTSFPLTVELRDELNNRVTDYTGNKTLTFSGASVAPDGVTRPTVVDRSAAAVQFGQPTALTFTTSGLTVGTAVPTVTLYKKEEIDVTATETVAAPGPNAGFDLSTYTHTTATPAHLLINAAPPSATKSTITASPLNVTPDGVSTSTLTVTVTDQYQNILPGLKVALASDRGSADTFSATTLNPTDFTGKTSATIRSSTRGLATVTAVILGPPRDVALPTRYLGTTATAFRAGPGGSTLWQAPTAAPGATAITTKMDYGTGTGSRQVKPGTTNATAGSAGASATNLGWRDESLDRTGQDTTTSRISGPWTFTYSLALSTGAQALTGQMTVVAYAVSATNVARELFRATSADLTIGTTEANFTHTFTPAYAALNGVAGGLAANEILQYELFLNVSANPNGGTGSVAQLRAGTAAAGLVAPTIAGPTIDATTIVTPAVVVNFLAATQPITLTKNADAHFAPGTAGSNLTRSANTVALTGTSPATAVAAGTAASGAAGDGAHTLQGNGGELLIVHAGGLKTTSVYSPSGAIAAGPSFPNPVGSGAFSLQSSAGMFLLVTAGAGQPAAQPLLTFFLTAPASAGGGWTSQGGPSLSGATGAGAGAHAIKYTLSGATRYLIVHGGGTAGTSVYDPAGQSMSPGPTLVGATAGAGAHAIARSDGKFLIVQGGGSSATNVFDPSGGGSGTLAAGPDLGAAVGAGGHAIQYTNGASAARFLVVTGNGSTTTKSYDPAATPAGTAGVSAGPAVPSVVGAGGESLLRADGSYLVLAGGNGSSAAVFTPSTELFAAATIIGLPSVGAGGHAFQRADGQYALVAGNGATSLSLYDAGWSAFFETEALNPSNVDSWSKIGWTKNANGTVTASLRTATSQGGLAAVTYTDVAIAQTASGSGAFAGAVGQRWGQGRLTLSRAVPQSSGAEQAVWLGASSVTQSRAIGAGPTVSQLTLTYLSASFAVTATATQAVGASNTATLTLKDSAGTTVTDYTGSHVLILRGAASAPDGTAPTATDSGSVAVAFGANTTVSFTAGVATSTLKLYKAETALVSASETVTLPGSSTTYTVATYTMDTSTIASVVVSAGSPTAATSAVSASPTSAPADNVTTSAISITVRDPYRNGVPSLATVTISSDRSSVDTYVQPAATDGTGLTTAKIRSTTSGVSTVSVLVGGVAFAIAPAATVTFTAATFTVTTQHGGTETAGVAFTLALVAKDAAGNTVTSYGGAKSIAFSHTASARTSPVAGPSPVVPASQSVTFTSGSGTATGFTLYNTAQHPVITATDGAFPTGTTAAVTIVPAAPSLTVSTLVGDPLTIAADGKDNSNLTAQVMDAFGNPISGKTVTLASSRTATDTIIQPPAVTDANGIAVGQIHSQTVGTPTMTATIVGTGNLTQTVTLNVVTSGGATRVLVIRTQNVEQETAGVAFSITITGIQADGTVDKTFCGSANCSITITNTATAAPDGTVPTGTISASVRFSNGTYTTNATDGTLTTLFRANQSPAPIITTTVVAGPNTVVGVTPSIVVLPGPVTLSKSYAYAVPEIGAADGTTLVTLGGKVVDNWLNPISGKTVTLASSRGATDTITQSTAPTGALGLVFGSIRSATQGSATITGTVTGSGAMATTATVTFFGQPGGGRIENGTRLGTVVNGVNTDTPLALVARDLEGVALPTGTTITWEVTGTGFGTLTTTTTTSGAATPTHTTFFTANKAGTVTVRGGYVIPSDRTGAGVQINVAIPFLVVSHFDVRTQTTTGRIDLARVEWDGTTLRVLSLVSTTP